MYCITYTQNTYSHYKSKLSINPKYTSNKNISKTMNKNVASPLQNKRKRGGQSGNKRGSYMENWKTVGTYTAEDDMNSVIDILCTQECGASESNGIVWLWQTRRAIKGGAGWVQICRCPWWLEGSMFQLKKIKVADHSYMLYERKVDRTSVFRTTQLAQKGKVSKKRGLPMSYKVDFTREWISWTPSKVVEYFKKKFENHAVFAVDKETETRLKSHLKRRKDYWKSTGGKVPRKQTAVTTTMDVGGSHGMPPQKKYKGNQGLLGSGRRNSSSSSSSSSSFDCSGSSNSSNSSGNNRNKNSNNNSMLLQQASEAMTGTWELYQNGKLVRTLTGVQMNGTTVTGTIVEVHNAALNI